MPHSENDSGSDRAEMPARPEPSAPATERGILGRFAHLLSAQAFDGVAGMVFLLYVAWVNSAEYGELMYAIAAGSIVMRVVQFGLYYPLVSELGRSSREEAPQMLHGVNAIKVGLTLPAMLGVLAVIMARGFSLQMALVLSLICFGFALEAVSETFFADLRVRGRQDVESRAKIIASAASYGYGCLGVALGFHPAGVALFRIVSSLVRIWLGWSACLGYYGVRRPSLPPRHSLWEALRAALPFALIELLGTIYNKTNVFFLESAAGVQGVAYYSATWLIVDPISVVASEQFLGWVIFPLLATLWWKDRGSARRLVRRNARWLFVLALPIMFILHTESDLIIGLVYPSGYGDAVWMQRYLVWTILLSFENNLFAYVMMVSGAAKMLLAFTAATTVLNIVLNVLLVEPFGLAGGCLVIIFTKLCMTVLTFLYCQVRFRLFRPLDSAFPLTLAGAALGLFACMTPVIGRHPAVAVTTLFYLAVLWKFGFRLLGRFPSRVTTLQEAGKPH
jgi:O-antigen/teichoic acid export membrane protein